MTLRFRLTRRTAARAVNLGAGGAVLTVAFLSTEEPVATVLTRKLTVVPVETRRAIAFACHAVTARAVFTVAFG